MDDKLNSRQNEIRQKNNANAQAQNIGKKEITNKCKQTKEV